MLEKTLESPMDSKEIKLVNPKGNQSWLFIGRTDAEAETPILWPPDAKNWLIGKDADAGKDWRQEEKGTTEDEMAGWHHWLNGRESEWTLGVDDGQGGLACCSSWGCKELDRTEWLNWTELNWYLSKFSIMNTYCFNNKKYTIFITSMLRKGKWTANPYTYFWDLGFLKSPQRMINYHRILVWWSAKMKTQGGQECSSQDFSVSNLMKDE